MLLGFVMVYSWIHALYIVATKIDYLTTYEKVVLVGATTFMLLYILGTI